VCSYIKNNLASMKIIFWGIIYIFSKMSIVHMHNYLRVVWNCSRGIQVVKFSMRVRIPRKIYRQPSNRGWLLYLGMKRLTNPKYSIHENIRIKSVVLITQLVTIVQMEILSGKETMLFTGQHTICLYCWWFALMVWLSQKYFLLPTE